MARRSARQQRRGKGKAKLGRIEPLYPKGIDSMPSILPRLLVFDLDNTLWTPELYQIRQKGVPKAGKEIWLFDGAQTVMADLATNPAWMHASTEFAIASRTDKGEWAETLLTKFEAVPGTSLADVFPHREIVTGSKRKHFERLRESTDVPFRSMVFFDDDARMNLEEVSQMGVLCCHCPRGLTEQLFRGTMERYDEMKRGQEQRWMGITLTQADLAG